MISKKRRKTIKAVAALPLVSGCTVTQPLNQSNSDEKSIDVEYGCPSVSADNVICYPKDDGAAIRLEPESTAYELPVGEITFTLYNDSAEALDWNPCKWELYVRTDGDWKFIAPDAYAMPASSLPSGESHTVTLHVGDRPGEGCAKYVEDLPANVYAFCVFGSTEGMAKETENAYFALFEVEAASE
jgi:hypothetical protein